MLTIAIYVPWIYVWSNLQKRLLHQSPMNGSEVYSLFAPYELTARDKTIKISAHISVPRL